MLWTVFSVSWLIAKVNISIIEAINVVVCYQIFVFSKRMVADSTEDIISGLFNTNCAFKILLLN